MDAPVAIIGDTRFRASQTFKELDDEVQKYDEWKKQQHPQTTGSEVK